MGMDTIKVATPSGHRIHLVRRYSSREDSHVLCGLGPPFQHELLPAARKSICKKCLRIFYKHRSSQPKGADNANQS